MPLERHAKREFRIALEDRRDAYSHLTPRISHLAACIADERAVVYKDGRTDGLETRHDPRVSEISRNACRGFGQVVKPEGICRHEVH